MIRSEAMIEHEHDVDAILHKLGISYPINAENRHVINRNHRRLKRKASARRFFRNLISAVAAFSLGAFLFGSPLVIKICQTIWSYIQSFCQIIGSFILNQ